METFIEDFIKQKEAMGISRKTILVYRLILKEFCKELTKPSEITGQMVIEYFSSIQKSEWSKTTKVKRIIAVKYFCEYLISINQLILNQKYLYFHVQNTTVKSKHVWSEDAMNMIIAKLHTKKCLRLKAIIELAYSCGLRKSELIKADLFDLNLNEKTLLVKESKGKDRLLPVTDKAILAITNYLELRKRIRAKTTALFITNKGTRIRDQDIQSTLFHLSEKLGFSEKITIHAIRNSIATHLLRRGMDFVLISKFLGHNHLTTSTIYTRVINNDLKEMIDQFHPRNNMTLE